MPDQSYKPSFYTQEDLEELLRKVRLNREKFEGYDQSEFAVQVGLDSARSLEKLLAERVEEGRRIDEAYAKWKSEQHPVESLESVHHDIKKEDDHLLYG